MGNWGYEGLHKSDFFHNCTEFKKGSVWWLCQWNAKINQQNQQAHLIIFPVDQGKFKAVFCWVDSEDAWPALPVQTVDTVSSYTGHIDG